MRDIEDALNPICARMKGMAVLIGELSHGTTASIERTKKIGHRVIDVFDALSIDGVDVSSFPLALRRRAMLSFTADMREWLRPVEQWSAGFASALDAQPEGIVIKSAHSPYSESDWLKVKKRLTADYVVMGLGPSKTHSGPASLVCGAIVGDKMRPLVKVPLRGDEAKREAGEHFERFMGRVVEIAHYGAYKNGSLRHPIFVRFRDDKRPSECVLA